jgi:hypothetical protein
LIGAPRADTEMQGRIEELITNFVTSLRTSWLIGPILDCIVAGQNEDCESERLTFCKRTSMHSMTLQNTIGPNFRHPDSRRTPPANLTWKPAI